MNSLHVKFLLKLLSPLVAAFIACIITLVAILYFAGSSLLQNQLQQRVQDESNFLALEYQEDGPIELLEEIEERLEKHQQSWRYLYAVQAPNGDWAFDALAEPPPLGWSRLHDIAYADQVLIYTRQLDDYRLTVGIAEEDLFAFKKAFVTNAGWLILASCFIAVLMGAYIYHRFRRIIRMLAQPVQQFADGQFEARIPQLSADPDLERLALNINAMFAQVEKLIDQLQTLSANIAHDLRTPLTRVKNNLSEISSTATPNQLEKLSAAETELEDVLRMFREILLLSEIKSGRIQTHFQKVDISELIRKTLEVYEPLLDQHKISVHCEVTSNIKVWGTEQLLKHVFVNIIENTLNHSAGNCDLVVKLNVNKKNISISFNDLGRPKASRNKHFGLGLGFVAAIVELHGGKASFDQRSEYGFISKIHIPINHQF